MRIRARTSTPLAKLRTNRNHEPPPAPLPQKNKLVAFCSTVFSHLHFGGQKLPSGVPDERSCLCLGRVSRGGKHLPRGLTKWLGLSAINDEARYSCTRSAVGIPRIKRMPLPRRCSLRACGLSALRRAEVPRANNVLSCGV